MTQPQFVTDGAWTAAKPRRRKRWMRVLWGMAALVVGLGLYWTWRHHAAVGERDRLVAELHARGEPVWWDEVVDRLLAEPTEGTGAEFYLKAVRALGGDYNPAGPKLPNGVLWNAIDNNGVFATPTTIPTHPSIDAEVRKQVGLAKTAYDFLEEAVKRKPGLLSANINGRSLKGSDPYNFLLPHMQDSRSLVRMNFWRLYDALARGADAEAYHAAWLGLAASEQLALEPWIISQWIRIDMQRQACRHLAYCLGYARVPEHEFLALDKLFAALDDSFNLDWAIKGDRALGLNLWSSGEVTKEVLVSSGLAPRSQNSFRDSAAQAWLAVITSSLAAPVRAETQVQELRFYARIAGRIDRAGVDLKEVDDAVAEYEAKAPIYRLIEFPAGKSKGIRAFAESVVVMHRRLVLYRIALRLRRHHDRHGAFPKRLEEVCDASMPVIPLQWFQGQPIVYSASPTGFTLNASQTLQDATASGAFKTWPKQEEKVSVELKSVPGPR